MTQLRLGTRRSPLALWQARWAQETLRATHPGLDVQIVEVESHGDVDLATPLSQMGSVGIFTQTLERELAEDTIDVAVHSLKDVPAQLAPGMVMSACSPREDPRDVWFHREGRSFADTAAGAKVATGSLRRQCQLLRARPDISVVGLRGNLQTRWRKFEEGQFDAMLLAAAGVIRLGWSDRVTEFLDLDLLLPAVGQGIVGLEVRQGSEAERLVVAIDHVETSVRAIAERSLLKEVAGGCVVPLAGHCVHESGSLHLRARLGTPDGEMMLEAEGHAPTAEASALGRRVGRSLLDQGGASIVRQAKDLEKS